MTIPLKSYIGLIAVHLVFNGTFGLSFVLKTTSILRTRDPYHDNTCEILHWLDDTNAFCSNDSLSELIHIINEELKPFARMVLS